MVTLETVLRNNNTMYGCVRNCSRERYYYIENYDTIRAYSTHIRSCEEALCATPYTTIPTPPPTLRREGTNNHGPAPGKLRGRSFVLLRQPISAMPTATHRRHTISRPGDIQGTPGRPPRSLY